jgi:hypothetical protein
MDTCQKSEADYALAVAIITPSGIFPNDADYRRANGRELVETVLQEAALQLKLTNTSDWVAFAHNREIDPKRSFAENELEGAVEIEWHKREGGGGA